MSSNNDIEFIKLNVQGRIQEIGGKLKEQDPLLPVHLSAIHQALIQYEELVHLLSDEDIKTLVAGQIKHTGVQVVKEVTKSSSAKVGSKLRRSTSDNSAVDEL